MMNDHAMPQGGWNLFARVLQEILAERGYGLGHLDDRTSMHPVSGRPYLSLLV